MAKRKRAPREERLVLKKLEDPRQATEIDKQEWSAIAVDDSRLASERFDALEQLAIAEGDFEP